MKLRRKISSRVSTVPSDFTERKFHTPEPCIGCEETGCRQCCYPVEVPQSPLLPFCEECGHDVGLPHSDSCGATGIVYPQPELNVSVSERDPSDNVKVNDSSSEVVQNVQVSDNPYPEGDGMHTAWNEGWDAALQTAAWRYCK